MLRGRDRIPTLAELAGPADGRVGALRRQDFTSLTALLPRLAEQRVVAIAGEGEATATVAIAVAAAAAASGRRTILVECDLSQPALAARLSLDAAPGLHEYLRWEAEPQHVLQPVVLAGPATASATGPLVCVCGGRPASKAETLLGLQSFAHMVEKLRAAYELTLLLAPSPLGDPGAALAVARQADALLAAVDEEAARDLRRALRALPPPVLGAVAVQRS
jgi:Mrp family chromosome partitioning ATPase